MEFAIDKQSLKDLNIFPQKNKGVSIIGIYDHTCTRGGHDVLKRLFLHPLKDLKSIESRQNTISFIHRYSIHFEFDKERLDFIDFYLNQNTALLRDHFLDAIMHQISYQIKPKNDYYIIKRGLEYLSEHLFLLNEFIEELNELELPEFFQDFLAELISVYEDSSLKSFPKPMGQGLSYKEMHRYDKVIRKSNKERIIKVLNYTYHLDAFITLAQMMKESQFQMPQIKESSHPYIHLKGFYHPLLVEPIKNDFQIGSDRNLCFVTGSNMSGKSTFLKCMALTVYLAHLGIPIPAEYMELSLFHGLFTTINIADDIDLGYSHYYSEVMRVKEIAIQIKEHQKVLVVFDELFRGTNVKDAFEASLKVTQGFTKVTNSLFFISSHIIEVAEKLKNINSVDFKCLESSLVKGEASYTYQLKEGISTERLGMSILKNEKVMEIIDSINED